MAYITKCVNCGGEFKRTNKCSKGRKNAMKKGNRNFWFCCAECYWKYKFRKIIVGENFMNYNKYDEVINGEQTYKFIAKELKEGRNVIIGWTDQEFTHYDISFVLGIDTKCGPLQRGLRQEYLYVGIVDKTFFGFRTDMVKMGDYIAEKLRLEGKHTSKMVSELINGIIEALKQV